MLAAYLFAPVLKKSNQKNPKYNYLKGSRGSEGDNILNTGSPMHKAFLEGWKWIFGILGDQKSLADMNIPDATNMNPV